MPAWQPLDVRTGGSWLKMNKNDTLEGCWLCGQPMQHSVEHVLPQAITYPKSLAVVGFLCASCNSRTGSEWDSALANACQPAFWLDSNYLSHLHASGRTRRNAGFLSVDGEDFKGTTDRQGNFQEKRTKPDVTKHEDGTVRVTIGGAADDGKLSDQMRGQMQRFSKVESVSWAHQYLRGSVYYDVRVDWSPIRKALIKSYLALGHHLGINPTVCNFAVDHLRSQANAVLCDPPVFVCAQGYVQYKHLLLLHSNERVLMGAAHISGLSKLALRVSVEGVAYNETLVPAVLSTEYDGAPVAAAYEIDLQRGVHQVLDIGALFSRGAVRYNPRGLA